MTGPQEARAVAPLSQPFRRRVRVGGSKSIACRALAAASVSEGASVVRGMLDAEDIAVLARGLIALGVRLDWPRLRPAGETGPAEETDRGSWPDEIRIHGLAWGERFPAAGVTVEAGAAGFPARQLAALAALASGPVTVIGTARMARRPMRPLASALTALGCPAAVLSKEGGLPVRVEGGGLEGGSCRLEGSSESSQFLSVLLPVLTRARRETVLRLDGPLVSAPYAALTLAVARQFELRVETAEEGEWRVIPGPGKGRLIEVGPDASSASYAFAAAAITAGEAFVEGLSRRSQQPDIAFLDLLESMGCRVRESAGGLSVQGGPLRGIRADLRAIPDSVPVLAAVALFAAGPTEIYGVAHLRHKESDRLAALASELGRLGGVVEELPDGLRIHPGPAGAAGGLGGLAAGLHGGRVDPNGDHRIAMAGALVGLRVPGVSVADPGCVAKSFPGFWDEIAAGPG